jgi:hypothetical protein
MSTKYELLDTENYFDQAEAVYTFCVLHHEGQASTKYSIFSSQIPFTPGMAWRESDVEENNEFYPTVSTWSDSELQQFADELNAYFESDDYKERG